MAARYELNIEEIEWSLRNVKKNFDKINDTLLMRREDLGDDILQNILAAYSYLNKLVKHGIQPLDRYELNHLLELNHIILCGPDPYNRKEYAEHIRETTDRFYKQEKLSISNLMDWEKKHRDSSPWIRAAGIYVMLISQPQLFLEGNHRTGSLLMSHMLVTAGHPPFVLTVDNAKAYFDPSTLAKQTNKNVYGKIYKLPKIKKNFAAFLKAQANPLLVKKIKKDGARKNNLKK
jgi:hypothetical protein